MAYRDPDSPPRWWVTASAIGSFVVGAYTMVAESQRMSPGERPTLLTLSYLLMAGGPVAWAIERFRK